MQGAVHALSGFSKVVFSGLSLGLLATAGCSGDGPAAPDTGTGRILTLADAVQLYAAPGADAANLSLAYAGWGRTGTGSRFPPSTARC